jgi:hypothetical protein
MSPLPPHLGDARRSRTLWPIIVTYTHFVPLEVGSRRREYATPLSDNDCSLHLSPFRFEFAYASARASLRTSNINLPMTAKGLYKPLQSMAPHRHHYSLYKYTFTRHLSQLVPDEICLPCSTRDREIDNG